MAFNVSKFVGFLWGVSVCVVGEGTEVLMALY